MKKVSRAQYDEIMYRIARMNGEYIQRVMKYVKQNVFDEADVDEKNYEEVLNKWAVLALVDNEEALRVAYMWLVDRGLIEQ